MKYEQMHSIGSSRLHYLPPTGNIALCGHVGKAPWRPPGDNEYTMCNRCSDELYHRQQMERAHRKIEEDRIREKEIV